MHLISASMGILEHGIFSTRIGKMQNSSDTLRLFFSTFFNFNLHAPPKVYIVYIWNSSTVVIFLAKPIILLVLLPPENKKNKNFAMYMYP